MPVLIFLLALLAHDYHVSKTNVRYVANGSQVQVEMHVFVEDLEAAIADAGGPALQLGTANEHEESDRYLIAYLEKHFKIDWNGTDLRPELIGWELEDDLHGLWLYLFTNVMAPPKAVTIQNTVITEYYADQKNIVKLFNGKERLTTILTGRDRISGTYAK